MGKISTGQSLKEKATKQKSYGWNAKRAYGKACSELSMTFFCADLFKIGNLGQ